MVARSRLGMRPRHLALVRALPLVLLLVRAVEGFPLVPPPRRVRVGAARCCAAFELPPEPTPELDAVQTVHVLCEGLRCNDLPTADAGVVRLFNFMTGQARVALAPPPPKAGMQGGVTLDYFVENAASPALGALIFCSSYALIGECRITPGSTARGDLAYQLIEVGNSPLEDTSDEASGLRSLIGAPDAFLEELLCAVREGREMPPTPVDVQVKQRFWVALEQQRRPPLAGCWLLKEMLPLKKTKWQVRPLGTARPFERTLSQSVHTELWTCVPLPDPIAGAQRGWRGVRRRRRLLVSDTPGRELVTSPADE